MEKKYIRYFLVYGMIISIWFLLGYFFPFFLYATAILWLILVIYSIFISIPDKIIFTLFCFIPIIYDLIFKQLVLIHYDKLAYLLTILNYIIFIFVHFVLFSCRVLQKKTGENKLLYRYTSIKKILLLILITCLAIIIHYILVIPY